MMIPCYMEYMKCAAWSSTDEIGEPLDSYQFSDDAEKRMRADLDLFCEEMTPELEEEYEESGGTPEQFAHDFWLNRNRHGAGFWDRGLGELGDKLTKMAKVHCSCDLYLNEETMEIEVA